MCIEKYENVFKEQLQIEAIIQNRLTFMLDSIF
jgi:hypothetical protein